MDWIRMLMWRPDAESARGDSSTPQGAPASTDSAITTANTQPDSSCTLLDLPAEIRNRILDLVTPPSGSILLRAECSTAEDGTRKYRFHPPPPAISTTCKQMQAEINYYRTNKFIFTDSMFQPGAFKIFTKLMEPAFTSIRHVRVSTVLLPEKSPPATLFEYTFDAETTADGSTSLTRRGKHGSLSPEAVMRQVKDFHPNREDGLCFCTIERLFSEPGSLFGQLCAFADAIADPEKYPGHKIHLGILCKVCNRTKLL